MNVKSEFALMRWECLNCHREENIALDRLQPKPLKEDAFQLAQEDHYDSTYHYCHSPRLRMVVVRVYTEEQ